MAKDLSWNIDIKLDSDSAMQRFQGLLDEASKGVESAQKQLNKELGGKEVYQVQLQYDSDLDKEIPVYKKILTEYNKIDNAAKQRAKTEKGSLTNLKAQLRQASQVRDGIAKMTVEAKGTEKAVRKISDRWREQDKIVQDLNRKIADASGNWSKMITSRIPGGDKIMNLANGLTQISFAAQGVVVAFQAIAGAFKPLVQRQKQVEGLSLALQGFGLNVEQSAQLMNNAKVQAFQYGASLSGLEKGYKRVSPAIMNAGGSMQDVSDAMASLSARTTTLGLNTEQSGRYIEAFAQVMGKGKLQGEELNQQFAELDGALRGQLSNYIEATHGITDFNKAMENGEITSKMFLRAFNAISEDMRNNLAGAVGEVQARLDDLNVAQIENIQNSLNTISMDSLRESLGPLGESFKRIMLSFNQFGAAVTTNLPGLKSFFMNFFKGIGIALDVLVRGFLAGTQILLKAIDVIIAGLGSAIEWVVKNVPGIKQIYNGLGDGLGALADNFNKGTDLILQLGEGALETGEDLSDLDGRILKLNNDLAAGRIGPEEYAKSLAKIKAEAEREINLKQLSNVEEKIKKLKAALKDSKQDRSEDKSYFDEEKEKVSTLRTSVQEYYSQRSDALKQQKAEMSASYDSELDRIKRNKDAAKTRHESEMSNLKAKNAEAMRGLEAEIGALQEQTPAEEKLAQLRKQEIVDKLKSKDITEKEKLELQAQLERMQRQKQITEKQLKLKAEKENAAKAEKVLAEQQKQEMKAMADQEKKVQEAKKESLREIKALQSELTAEQKGVMRLFKDTKDIIDVSGKSLGDIKTLVSEQVMAVRGAERAYKDTDAAVKTLEGSLRIAETRAKSLETAAKRAAEAANAAGNPGRGAAPGTTGTVGGAFGGGSVRGGEKWTVNELGREGFMDIQGRMREINAPAFGAWKAPSSGTIIPAHIWAAIKAQQSAGGSSGGPMPVSSPSSLMAQVAALGRAGSNDVVTNNVTIQTDNVDRTMAQSLVSLRRTKRARYY